MALDHRRCRTVPPPTLPLLGHEVVTLVATVLPEVFIVIAAFLLIVTAVAGAAATGGKTDLFTKGGALTMDICDPAGSLIWQLKAPSALAGVARSRRLPAT